MTEIKESVITNRPKALAQFSQSCVQFFPKPAQMDASMSESVEFSKILPSVKEDKKLLTYYDGVSREFIEEAKDVYGPRLYANFKPSKPNANHFQIVARLK